MGALVNGGARVRVTLESVTVSATDPTYKLVIESSGKTSFKDGAGTVISKASSGVHSLQTHETFQDQQCTLEMPLGDLGLALENRILPNDFLSVEIAGNTDPSYRLAFLGLASSITRMKQSTPKDIKTSLVIQAQGLKKLFSQAIYNWQGALALGNDVRLGSAVKQAYDRLTTDGLCLAPHIIIKRVAKIGVCNSIQALIHNKPVVPGGVFNFGSGGLWSSAYPSDMFPNTAATLMNTWNGDLWSFLQSLAEPDIHELFWTYGYDSDQIEKPILIHRPRPFPALKEVKGKKQIMASAWNALYCHNLGLGSISHPNAIGIMRQRSDSGRVNAFHWEQGFSSDQSSGSGNWKLALGWWADRISMAKYGFASRMVGSNLLPLDGQNYMDLLGSVLLQVASQEAPLYLMGNESRTYGVLLPGLHVGEALEDWTEGKPTTGYVSSVSQAMRWTPNSLQASATVGLSRCMQGVGFSDYPNAVQGLVDLVHVDYLHNDFNHPARVAARGAAGQILANGPSNIPNAPLIQAAAKRAGVPAWAVAAVYRAESSCGQNKAMGKLGPMQILPDAVTQLASIGYTKEDGTPFTLGDRINTQAALDAGAAYLAWSAKEISCPVSNVNYWGFAGMAYRIGVTATNTSCTANNPAWAVNTLSSYGSQIMQGKSSFSSLGS